MNAKRREADSHTERMVFYVPPRMQEDLIVYMRSAGYNSFSDGCFNHFLEVLYGVMARLENTRVPGAYAGPDRRASSTKD